MPILNKALNVTLTLTDDKGLSDLDKIMLGVKGSMSECGYTYEDVEQAFSKGYNDSKLENQATYDPKSKRLYIPLVLIEGDIQEWKMRQLGKAVFLCLQNNKDGKKGRFSFL